MQDSLLDIAIIGAGLAGLACAHPLQQLGYRVVVFDKARGMGGRATTRRLQDTCVDRGLPYLEEQGDRTRELIARLQAANSIELWGDRIYTLPENRELARLPAKARYVQPQGMSAIAKFLAGDLDVRCNHRLTSLTPTTEGFWQLAFDTTTERIPAKAVVMAIPAAQALNLLQPLTPTHLSPEFLHPLQAVEFDPGIALAAGYSDSSLQTNWPWQAVHIEQDPDLVWVIDERSKRKTTSQPVFIFHSTPAFARSYLDAADVNAAAEPLLSRAAQLLFPELKDPEWSLVHRWRYARPRRPLAMPCLATAQPLPLVCCGDWCLGDRVEDALQSGLAAAQHFEILDF